MNTKNFYPQNHSSLTTIKCVFLTLVVFGVGIVSAHSALAAAWQASASISGNNVTTAPLITVTTEQVVTASDLATNLGEVVADPTSWFFFNDENSTIDNSLGSFVVGPGTPLIGTGGVQISVTGTQRRNLATYQFAGVKLADIRTLAFTTYNPSLGNGGSVNRSAYLQFNVTFTGADTWQRRLIFVPANNGTVVQNTWQEWDAINNGNALWGWSGFAANGNQWPDGNTTELRTWQSLLVAFPQIAIRTTDSWLGLRVGEPYPDGYTENIDSFTIGVINGFTQNVVTYDFEPTPLPPTSSLPPPPPPPPFVPTLGSVVINEIMWMGSVGDGNDEWLELRNMTSGTINLTGWTIENAGTGSGSDGTIALVGTIEPNGYFLISRKTVASSSLANTITIDQVASLSFSNGGEVLTLRTAGGVIIDSTPTGGWAAGTNGSNRQSMERNAVPGLGSLTTSWHTCIVVGCTSIAFWDAVGNNYGTPRATNLSENDPTSPEYTGTGLGEQGTSATASSDSSDILPPEGNDEEYDSETNSSPSTDLTLDPENTDTDTSTSTNYDSTDEMTSGENDEDQTTSNSPAEPAGGDENPPAETTGSDTGDNTAASADTDNADAPAETESGSTDSLESSAPAVTE